MLIPDTFLTIHEETLLFLWSCLLGAALGLLFDAFRALRLIIPHKGWAVALEDVVFLLIWAGAVVCFTSVLAKGDLRIYYLAGNLLGLILYRLTLGNPVVRLLRRILDTVLRLLRWCLRPITGFLVSMYRKYRGKFVRNAKNEKKLKNIHIAPLIAPCKMLYNKRNKMRKQGEKKGGKEEKDESPEEHRKCSRRKQQRKKGQA